MRVKLPPARLEQQRQVRVHVYGKRLNGVNQCPSAMSWGGAPGASIYDVQKRRRGFGICGSWYSGLALPCL